MNASLSSQQNNFLRVEEPRTSYRIKELENMLFRNFCLNALLHVNDVSGRLECAVVWHGMVAPWLQRLPLPIFRQRVTQGEQDNILKMIPNKWHERWDLQTVEVYTSPGHWLQTWQAENGVDSLSHPRQTRTVSSFSSYRVSRTRSKLNIRNTLEKNSLKSPFWLHNESTVRVAQNFFWIRLSGYIPSQPIASVVSTLSSHSCQTVLSFGSWLLTLKWSTRHRQFLRMSYHLTSR